MNDLLGPRIEKVKFPENNVENMLIKINQLIELINSEDIEALESLGFDPELLPVMQLAAAKAPRILGTYSHPGEFDLYKIVAAIRLTNLAESLEIPSNQILVTQLDTIDPKKSARRPLGIGNFGINSSDSLSFVHESKKLSIDQITESLLKQLENDLVAVLKLNKVPKEAKQSIRNGIKEILTKRLSILFSIKPEFDSNIHTPELQKQLAEFNIKLAALILESVVPVNLLNLYLKNIGIETLSFSREYRNFIIEQICSIIRIKGINIIKQLVIPGKNEGLVFLFSENETLKLTVNESGNFEIISNKGGGNLEVSDEDFIPILEQGLALGKLESLVLLAGGVTMHVGSSHGADQIAIELLNVKGSAREFLSNLQIGEDGTQGHEGLVFNELNVPLPLQYLMLGATGVRRLIKDTEMKFESIDDLRRYFVENLVKDVFEMLDKEV